MTEKQVNGIVTSLYRQSTGYECELEYLFMEKGIKYVCQKPIFFGEKLYVVDFLVGDKLIDEIEISKRSGRKSQSLTIVNIESGEEFEFGSKKDCMVFLGCSSRTFKKFLEDKSKLNKVWSLKSKNN